MARTWHERGADAVDLVFLVGGASRNETELFSCLNQKQNRNLRTEGRAPLLIAIEILHYIFNTFWSNSKLFYQEATAQPTVATEITTEQMRYVLAFPARNILMTGRNQKFFFSLEIPFPSPFAHEMAPIRSPWKATGFRVTEPKPDSVWLDSNSASCRPE